MKDWGIYSGTGSSAYCILSSFSVHSFHWWEWALITVFFLLKITFWGFVCGAIGMAINEQFSKQRDKWIGKKKELKLHT